MYAECKYVQRKEKGSSLRPVDAVVEEWDRHIKNSSADRT
jgi:hypothetical protein